MKRQTKTNCPIHLVKAIIIIIFIFATSTLSFAQINYKVGDHVETMSAGEWVEVEIIKVQDNGDYLIRYVKSGISGAWAQAKHLRPIKAGEQTSNQNTSGNQGQNQTNRNTETTNRPAAMQQKNSINEKFGSREPRNCDDTRAPVKGAITADLAKKYFISQAEKVWSGHMYLVENVKLEVGASIPYHPTLGAFEAIDVRVPLYPIRGSYIQYQCNNLKTEHVGPPDTNCTIYNYPKATGYCYKTTLGEWHCFMADRSNNPEDMQRGVAPPK